MNKAKSTRKILAVVARRRAGHSVPAPPPSATDELPPDPETPTFETPPDDVPHDNNLDVTGEDSQVDSSEPDNWLKSEQPTTP